MKPKIDTILLGKKLNEKMNQAFERQKKTLATWRTYKERGLKYPFLRLFGII